MTSLFKPMQLSHDCGNFGFTNRIVSRFPSAAQYQFAQNSQYMNFDAGQDVLVPDDTLLFIESGSLSMLEGDVKDQTEILTLGNEALVGVEGLYGTARIVVLRAAARGSAWQISKTNFASIMRNVPAVQALCAQYLEIYIGQLLRQILCCNRHDQFSRVVSSILIEDIRLKGELVMTQLALGRRLSASRGSVNRLANKLADKGLIRYTRGKIEILRRYELEKLSCACFNDFLKDLDKMQLRIDV